MHKMGGIYQFSSLNPTRYFQLVALDMTCLNSDVIAVFQPVDISEAVSDEERIQRILKTKVAFFTHSMVSIGAKQGEWSKIGTATPVSFKNTLFKDTFYKDDLPDIEPYEADHYHSWVIWHVGEEWQHIGAKVERYPQAELGHVFPPEDITYRVEHGKYFGTPHYGQVR